MLAGLFSPDTSLIVWVAMLASLWLAGLFAVKEVANAGKRGTTATWATTNLAVRLWMVTARVMAPVVAAWGILASVRSCVLDLVAGPVRHASAGASRGALPASGHVPKGEGCERPGAVLAPLGVDLLAPGVLALLLLLDRAAEAEARALVDLRL